MASESPWAVLAERLGYRIAEGIYVRSRLRYAMPIDHEETHSMLVGETLRVAWAWAVEHGKIYEYILAVDMVTQSNPKCLAEHCLRLLDAVGYPASS
jgi:hypothetical protein